MVVSLRQRWEEEREGWGEGWVGMMVYAWRGKTLPVYKSCSTAGGFSASLM